MPPSGKKVTKVIAKKVWTTTRTGTKKYLEKKIVQEAGDLS